MAAIGTSLANPKLPYFNGKNYDYCTIALKTLFASKYISDLVDNGFQEPADVVALNALTQAQRDLLKENRKKDSKSLFYIFQSFHESIFPRISAATNSRKAWDTL